MFKQEVIVAIVLSVSFITVIAVASIMNNNALAINCILPDTSPSKTGIVRADYGRANNSLHIIPVGDRVVFTVNDNGKCAHYSLPRAQLSSLRAILETMET